jgi:hypothetical protein
MVPRTSSVIYGRHVYQLIQSKAYGIQTLQIAQRERLYQLYWGNSIFSSGATRFGGMIT